MKGERYLRQQTVPGVGPSGQARIAAGEVRVDGDGLDAEVAALYLAGAGVGALGVAPALRAACEALNSTIRVASTGASGPLQVSVGPRQHAPLAEDPVGRGAAAARWALACLLSPEGA